MHSPCHRTFSLKRVAGLSFPARVERAQFHRARSASKKDGLAAPFISFRGCCLLTVSSRWGVIDLLLRASNEGSPRPRVARARKIIRLHSLACSASTAEPFTPLSLPLLQPALVARPPLSFHRGQRRRQGLLPPSARSYERHEDSRPAAAVESTTRRLDR